MGLGNPVPGPIRPFGTAGSGFGVTAVFGAIDAFHPPPGHQGIDIGDGKCGSPILAVEDGTISEILTAPNGARIVRYSLDKYPGYQAALAHMDTFDVKLGQKVLRGQVVGHIGRSGTTACHLHAGMKLNGTEIDWWPLLDQNQEGDVLQGTNPRAVINRQVSTKADHTRFRAAPATGSTPVLVEIAAGQAFYPDFVVDGEVIAANPRWYAGFGVTAKGRELGYLHESVVSAPTPVEKADCSSEVTAATAPLLVKINAAKIALGE